MLQNILRLTAADISRNNKDEVGVIIVCGTGYVMPDARAIAGIIEPRLVSNVNIINSLKVIFATL